MGNLVGGGLCSERTGNILGVYMPWAVSWMLYQGDAIKEFVSWGGVLCISVVCFLAPLFIALEVTEKSRIMGSIDVFSGFLQTRDQEIECLWLVLATSFFVVSLAITDLALHETM